MTSCKVCNYNYVDFNQSLHTQISALLFGTLKHEADTRMIENEHMVQTNSAPAL